MDVNYFGLYAAQLRRRKKLRQKQVAARTGLDPSYVAALESGRRKPPRQLVIANLAAALDASDSEVNELRRAAILTQVARAILDHAEHFSGSNLALSILDLSPVLSPDELLALGTIVEGYRYRVHVQGGSAM